MAGLQEYPAFSVRESAKELPTEDHPFLPVQESVWKKSVSALRDRGVCAALEQIANAEDEAPWAKAVAGCCLSLYQVVWAFPGNIYSHLQLPSADLMDIYCKVPLRSQAVVRAVQWHPTAPHLAVATRDQVRVHHFAAERAGTCTALRDRQQCDITDLQWAPHCSGVLAVSCEQCVLVWCLDLSGASQSRLTPTSARVESCHGHAPITSLSWSPQQLHLITCSPCDTRMKLWDVSLGQHVDLERQKGGGVTMVKWSHDGSRVFAATPSPMFRVWETSEWTCEQWTNLARPCSAAVWDLKGDTLLFALREEPSIFSISFPHSGSIAPSNAVRCVDLSLSTTLQNGRQARFSGTIKDLIWHCSGSTLAAMFDDCSEVVVLHTKLWPAPELSVVDVIQGPPGTYPLVMAFQPFTKSPPVITVAWSSGLVTTETIQ